MSKIFISHSSTNNAAALAVAKWLADSGWSEYFLDITPSRGLAPGERWQEALKSAADRCEAVLFLISPAWQASPWCLAECNLAKLLGKTIFGVLVEPTPFDKLPKDLTAEWQLCDLVTGTARQSFRVSQEPIVPETEVSFAEDGLLRLRIGLQRAGLDPASFAWPPPSDPNRAPYRGLKALEPEDAAVFFGREAAIVRGLDALRGSRERGVERLFVILGASGAGKSSFLRAGLWPRLIRDDRHFLPLPVIRPERAVLSGATGLAASLEAAFRERKAARSRAVINQALQEPRGFDRLLTELQTLATSRIAPDASPPIVVISIDQGEELFSAEGAAEAGRCLDLLAQTLSPPAGEGAVALAARQRALAIVAIRSDSYERLQTEPRLAQVAPYLFSLPPIARAEFKAVVEGPARRHTDTGRKLTVDPALTERLVYDTEGADALPLLAFTLERLFVEHGGDGKLLLDDYKALGGVRGSIEVAVELAFAEPGRAPVVPADKAARERLLRAGFIPWLARVDPDTEERKRRVARWEEIPSEARPLLERLIEQRLLVRDRRKLEGREDAVVVEVAHEALLRQWPTLTAWLDEDTVALKMLDAVQRAAGEWAKNREETAGGGAWLVHTGERLAAAEALRRRPDFERLLGADGQAYVDACRARDERVRQEKGERAEADRIAKERELEQAKALAEAQRQRADEQVAARIRQRRFSWGLLALLALAVGTALYALQQRDEAVVQRRNAASREYSARALLAMETDPAEALRLAISAGELGDNPDSDAALRRAIGASHLEGVLSHDGGTTDADFASTQVVTVGNDGRIRVWGAATGRPSQTMTGVVADEMREGLRGIAISPDATRIAVRGGFSQVQVWDLGSKRELHHFDTFNRVVHVGFSPDGADVLAVHGATVTRRRTEDGSALRKVSGTVLRHATMSPDGTLLAAASDDGHRVQLYDAQTGAGVGLLSTGGSTRRVAISADGKWLAAVSEARAPGFMLWNIADPRKPVKYDRLRLDVIDVRVECAAFFPRSLRLVMGSSDGVVRVWNGEKNGGWELVGSLRGHAGPIRDVAVSRAENIAASAGSDGTVRVWIQQPGDWLSRESWQELSVAKGHRGPAAKVRLNDDGRRMLTVGSEDGRAMLWNTDPNSEAGTVGPLFSKVDQVVLDSKGMRAALLAKGAPYVLSRVDGKSSAIGSRDMFGMASYRGVRLSLDGQSLLLAGPANEAAIYDVATGKARVVFRGHVGSVGSAEYDQSGTRVVTAGDDKTLRVWDAASGEHLASIATGGKAAWAAIFSPDGRQVVSIGGDQPARVWSTDGRLVATLGQSKSFRVRFNADGARFWTTEGNTARVWNTRDWRLHGEVSSSFATPYAVIPLGEDYVLFSDFAEAIELVAPDKRRTTLRGHKAKVTAAALSPDCLRLVTGDESGKVIVWHTSNGKVASEIHDHTAEVTNIAFSRDGRIFITGSDYKDGTARLYVLRVSDLVTLARLRLPRGTFAGGQ